MEDLRQSAMANPAVQQALSVFSGRLVDVHDLTEQNI